MTICYAQGCVYNMAQSTAYVQPGDSGGSWFASGIAIGITSGMGGDNLCGTVVARSARE